MKVEAVYGPADGDRYNSKGPLPPWLIWTRHGWEEAAGEVEGDCVYVLLRGKYVWYPMVAYEGRKS